MRKDHSENLFLLMYQAVTVLILKLHFDIKINDFDDAYMDKLNCNAPKGIETDLSKVIYKE